MKTNFTKKEYENSKSCDLLSCICYNCNRSFLIEKKLITYEMKNPRRRVKFCSPKCNTDKQSNKIEVKCTNCNKITKKIPSQIKRSKSGNHFCSRSCAGTYNTTHKKYGTKISKLEKWIKKELIKLYPELNILYNNKEKIKSELDVYIPSLNLAFELNGIFHYEPIYGEDTLKKIQNNDNRKFQACLEQKIEFCVIDTSQQKYFKESTSIKYLNIITDLIDMKSNFLLKS